MGTAKSSKADVSRAAALARELGRYDQGDAANFWGEVFVKLPRRFLIDGFFDAMRPTESALLITIFQLASTGRGVRPIEIQTGELCQAAGIARRSYYGAIRKLVEGGVVSARMVTLKNIIELLPPRGWKLKVFKARREVQRSFQNREEKNG